MRGRPGAEIVTAMDAFACDVCIVTPAFPDLGRTVVNEDLHVHGDSTWNPLNVVALLRSQGVTEWAHFTPAAIGRALADGAR
jgi:hypothetical protein